MRSAIRSAMVLPLLALALLAQGCVAVAVGSAAAAGGATAAVYRRGWYSAGLVAPHFRVDQSVRSVCRRARLLERNRSSDGSKSSYMYQDIRDVKVRIKLKSMTPDSTKIYIRVGFWGDRTSSVELFQAIQEDSQKGL